MWCNGAVDPPRAVELTARQSHNSCSGDATDWQIAFDAMLRDRAGFNLVAISFVLRVANDDASVVAVGRRTPGNAGQLTNIRRGVGG